MRAQFPCQRSWYRFFKEKPNMGSFSGPRALESSRQVQSPGCFTKRIGIFPPIFAIKIRRQKEARFVKEHRVDAHHKAAPLGVAPGQMPCDDLTCHRQELSIRAICTFDSWLLANPANPLIPASRCV